MVPSQPARGADLISVVLPVHNAARTLPAALDSVLAQTDPRWEVIAVDDGSTDESAAVLEHYRQRDSRIRVIHRPRCGLVAALNAGLAAAIGRLIARLDADDVCLPDRLARQRHHLDSHPGLGLVGSRVRFGGDCRTAAGYARHVSWANRVLTHEEISLARFVESPLPHPSVVFRREVVERWGGYRHGDFPEDYELWLRWLEAGVAIEKLPDPLLIWNDSATRLSRRDPRYGREAFYRLKAGYLARWLAAHNPHHPRIVIWGAGRINRKRARHLLGHGIAVAAYVDVDPNKVGRSIAGRPVIAPEALPSPERAFVVSYVSSPRAREEIEAALREKGYDAGRHYILAA